MKGESWRRYLEQDPGRWWREGVLYQVYPRSFADADGDGIGDLRGLLDRLDYLQWLGVDGIWLNPTMPSPNDDWGYDVSDYLGVHPELGTPTDLERVITEARARGIRVLLDLVPNHTSSAHPWFAQSRSGRGSPRRDWYVWADPAPDGGPPNNWLSSFGGPAWTLDPATGQYYLHNFLPTQPDLNWWSPEVRAAFREILEFWFRRGVAGFRIDVCHGIVKDRALRDNPPASAGDPPPIRGRGQRPIFNANRPEVHAVLREWRRLTDRWDPPRVLVGETVVLDLHDLGRYYGTGDELHLAFNFPFIHEPFTAAGLRGIVDATEAALPPGAWPVWTASNHDVSRFPSRWCEGVAARCAPALTMLLTLRGTPVLYYGDEIGMTDGDVPPDRIRDPVGRRNRRGRDPARTPMQWEPGPGAGFTAPGVTPWLPPGDARACNVAAQRDRPDSLLSLTRRLIALRRDRADLRIGAYRPLAAPPGVWAYRRGDATAVALNLTGEPVRVAGLEGTVLAATRPEREGRLLAPSEVLQGWEGLVVGAGA